MKNPSGPRFKHPTVAESKSRTQRGPDQRLNPVEAPVCTTQTAHFMRLPRSSADSDQHTLSKRVKLKSFQYFSILKSEISLDAVAILAFI